MEMGRLLSCSPGLDGRRVCIQGQNILYSASEATSRTRTHSVAILPLRNASGEQSLDWLGPSLAEMLRTDLGQSSSLVTVSSDRLHQILRDLRIAAGTSYDLETLRRVAEFTNADKLVWGQYIKAGDQIRIDATLQDLKQNKSIPLKAEAPNEREVLSAVGQLAKSIQQKLTLSPDTVKELRATAFTPSSKSIQALRHYSEGLELFRQGNNATALNKFQASIKDDPEFALAHSKLGQTYAKLGYDNDAQRISQKAVSLSANLPPQERYRIVAHHARIVNSNQKAIEAYETLARISPTILTCSFNWPKLIGTKVHLIELGDIMRSC